MAKFLNVLAWMFSVLMFLCTTASWSTGQFLTGLTSLLVGLCAFPPLWQAEIVRRIKIPIWARWVAALVAIVFIGSTAKPTAKSVNVTGDTSSSSSSLIPTKTEDRPSPLSVGSKGKVTIENSANGSKGEEELWIVKTEDAVKAHLKDSEAVKFRDVNFHRYQGTPVVCGKVNSKNSFGGYSGYQRFIASGDVFGPYLEEDMERNEFAKTWNIMCGS